MSSIVMVIVVQVGSLDYPNIHEPDSIFLPCSPVVSGSNLQVPILVPSPKAWRGQVSGDQVLHDIPPFGLGDIRAWGMVAEVSPSGLVKRVILSDPKFINREGIP